MKKYNVIYADPPWSYSNKKTGGSMISGAGSHYDTMPIEDICAMGKNELKDLIAKDCVLFMWATVPLMPEAFKVLDAWGFKYKTMITWRKVMSMGMGFWFRGQTEHLLLGTKGKVKAFRLQEANIIQCKVEKHSKKPEVFRQLIERAIVKMESPEKLELFARHETGGWDVFGNQVSNSILLPTKKDAA